VLGSTGSIGTQGLEVIEKHNDKFEIVGLSAGKNFELLADQIRKFNPQKVSVTDDKTADLLKQNLGATKTEIIVGENASAEIAQLGSDVVLNGITGAAGLPATMSALKAGAKLALANKESLVIGGKLVLDIAAKDQIIPVDSEHSALAQCLRGENKSQIKKLILTASGGPFRGRSKSELEKVTLEETLKHPTWAMGQVVTINSATLMNKGLEVIEAHLLFGIDFKDIEVVVHPQSIVHSMVEFVDGSTMAQASPPNMKVPIALALSWPDRLENISPAIDWTKSSNWNFEPVDENVFSALKIARKAGEAGSYIPAVMNAANEVCVEAFIQNQIKFTKITDIVEKIVDLFLLNHKKDEINKLTLDDIYKMDFEARKKAKEMILL
jgi:1-deoxy-D-xylulose-5-phosphate reductoisomerase